MVGTCDFIDVDPDDVGSDKLKEVLEAWKTDPQANLYTADSLTKMREDSTTDTDLRIVWGGRITGAAGWMAGILEEVAFSIEQGKPVLILGGFGGCAHLLANFLAKEDSPWPNQLSLAGSANKKRDELLKPVQRSALEKCFTQIQEQLIENRSQLWSNDSINGLPTDLARSALEEETPRRAISIAAGVAN